MRKAACTRVHYDAEFSDAMFGRLEQVWGRTVEYRGDRERYLSEVGAAVVAPPGPARGAFGAGPGDAEAVVTFASDYAFVDDDDAAAAAP